jgi:hypothetical protein
MSPLTEYVTLDVTADYKLFWLIDIGSLPSVFNISGMRIAEDKFDFEMPEPSDWIELS